MDVLKEKYQREALLIHKHTNVTLKADLHQKKIVLSIWWDWKGILYHELLPRNKTMNSNVYCEQLKK